MLGFCLLTFWKCSLDRNLGMCVFLSVYPVVVCGLSLFMEINFIAFTYKKSNVSSAAVIGVFEISTYKYVDSFSSSKWIWIICSLCLCACVSFRDENRVISCAYICQPPPQRHTQTNWLTHTQTTLNTLCLRGLFPSQHWLPAATCPELINFINRHTPVLEHNHTHTSQANMCTDPHKHASCFALSTR